MSSTTYYYIAVRKYNGVERFDYKTIALLVTDALEKSLERESRHPNLPPVVRIARVRIEEVKGE